MPRWKARNFCIFLRVDLAVFKDRLRKRGETIAVGDRKYRVWTIDHFRSDASSYVPRYRQSMIARSCYKIDRTAQFSHYRESEDNRAAPLFSSHCRCFDDDRSSFSSPLLFLPFHLSILNFVPMIELVRFIGSLSHFSVLKQLSDHEKVIEYLWAYIYFLDPYMYTCFKCFFLISFSDQIGVAFCCFVTINNKNTTNFLSYL